LLLLLFFFFFFFFFFVVVSLETTDTGPEAGLETGPWEAFE
jgi:hypothetical protein